MGEPADAPRRPSHETDPAPAAREPFARVRTVRPAASRTVTATVAGARSEKVMDVRSARPSPVGEIAAGVAFADTSAALTATRRRISIGTPPGAVPRMANR